MATTNAVRHTGSAPAAERRTGRASNARRVLRPFARTTGERFLGARDNGAHDASLERREALTVGGQFAARQSLAARVLPVERRFKKRGGEEAAGGAVLESAESSPASTARMRPSSKARIERAREAEEALTGAAGAAKFGTYAVILGWCLFGALICMLAGLAFMGLGQTNVLWFWTVDSFAPASSAGLLFMLVGAFFLAGAAAVGWLMYRNASRVARVFRA
jgi:hypothetical protein